MHQVFQQAIEETAQLFSNLKSTSSCAITSTDNDNETKTAGCVNELSASCNGSVDDLRNGSFEYVLVEGMLISMSDRIDC